MPLSLLLLISLFSQAAIFGVDDRVALNASAPEAPLARSTAISVLSGNLSTNANGRIDLDADSMKNMVCKDERFSFDPSLSWSCTGFLVGPDMIATAGHCMVNTGEVKNERGGYCEVFSWLFDFQREPNGAIQIKDLDPSRLFHCEEILYAVKEEIPPYRDYALVRLKRAAPPERQPLTLADGPVDAKNMLRMIGHPFGTPAKLSRNARVLLDDPNRQSFITSLDAFEGNSGSPVFNRASEVVGILVGGTPTAALVTDTAKSCEVYNRCANDGTGCTSVDKNTDFPGTKFQRIGSEVQRIDGIAMLLRNLAKAGTAK